MKKIIFTLLILTILVHQAYSQANEQIINGEFQFGNDVAIDGEWAVVGNMWDEGTNPNIPQTFEDVGSVSVYKQNVNGSWEIHTVLQENFWYNATNEVHGINYGMSVDIDGEWIVVGANYDSDQDPTIGPDGAVFVYKYDDVNDWWLFHQKLSIHDAGITPHPVNNFGFSVSVTESLIVIGDPDYGAHFDQAFLGTAYVYELNAGNWEFQQQLLDEFGWASGGPINLGYGDEFGYSVAATGNDYIVVGIPNYGVENDPLNTVGQAYFYEKVGGNWQRIRSFSGAYTKFGREVDILGNVAYVGSSEKDQLIGSLMVFTNGEWNFEPIPRLYYWNRYQAADNYTHSVAIGKVDENNYTLVVSAPLFDGVDDLHPDAGEVAIYHIPYPYPEELVPPPVFPYSFLTSGEMAAGNEFGNAVAIDKTGSNLLVGSWMTDSDPEPGAEGAVSFFNMQAVFAGVWDGEEDNDWNNPTNWTDDNVPNGFTNVTIPADAINMPELDGFANCLNLSVPLGASITLNGEFAELRINGDLSVYGEIIVPAGELNELAKLNVGGTTFMYCEVDKQFPGGIYNGEVTINGSSGLRKATMAGDVTIYDDLSFAQTNGRLDIADHTLELHGLVGGYVQGLRTNSSSNLILAGEPPIPFRMPSAVNHLNNLTVNNGEGVSEIVSGNLSIHGTLNLLSGDFKVFTSGGTTTLSLYNSVTGDQNLFITDHESSIWIMGDNAGIQYPSNSTEVFQLIVNNPNEITLNNNLLIHANLFLLSGGANANGNQVSFTATGELWSAADITIDDGLFDLNNAPHKIHVAFGANVLFDAVGAVEDIELGGFPAPMNLSPELFDQIVADQNRSVNNLTSLEIQPQKGISVQNQLIANGALVLKSDINGNSSFIDDRNSPDDVSATVENYLTSGRWHFVSPSVEEATAAAYYVENGSDIWMKEFNETTNQWEYISSLTHPLSPGKGYAIWVDEGRADEKAVYEGVLNNGDLTVNLSYSGVDQGWNLIGNPFPSSLDLGELGWSQSNTTAAVYVYDNGNFLSSNLTGEGTLTEGIIPPGQGFFVQATAANASFTLPQNARVHSAQSFYKEPASTVDALILNVSKDGKRDKSWVSFSADATDEFDQGRDAWRLEGDAGMPQLYTRFGDRQLSINVMSELVNQKSVPVYFEAPTDGNYLLEFDLMETFADTEIILEDHITGEMYDLSQHNALNFEAFVGSDPHRFTIHFNKTITGLQAAEATESNVHFYSRNGKLFAESLTGFEGGVLTLYSLSGQLLQQAAYAPSGLIQFDAEAYRGQMLVVVLTDGNARHATKLRID